MISSASNWKVREFGSAEHRNDTDTEREGKQLRWNCNDYYYFDDTIIMVPR
jgi:hypothetical protein